AGGSGRRRTSVSDGQGETKRPGGGRLVVSRQGCMIKLSEPFRSAFDATRRWWLLHAAAMLVAMATAAPAGGRPAARGKSGLPVPRFVSLKPDRVNVRSGPTRDHEVAWVYTRAGLPVEITAESDNWRRIRDWEGAEGWVYHSMLSGRRTALVKAKDKDG